MHLRQKSDMSHAHDIFATISCKPTEMCVFCHCLFLLERERDDDGDDLKKKSVSSSNVRDGRLEVLFLGDKTLQVEGVLPEINLAVLLPASSSSLYNQVSETARALFITGETKI